MYPELFHIGNVTIYSYGVMLAVGFIVATLFARRMLVTRYHNPDVVLDLVLAAVVGGIVGARLFYVVGHWSYFMANPSEIIKIRMDGLVFYGGLIVGLGLALLVGYFRKLRFWQTLDMAGVCVPVALGIGRIGCLLNGCCYGKPTGLPWGITYPASSGIVGARHPTQIYELVLDFALFGYLWWKRDSFDREGTAFWVFVLGYTAIRFTVEFWRYHEPANAALAFQLGSAVFFVVAALALLFRYRLLPSASTRIEHL